MSAEGTTPAAVWRDTIDGGVGVALPHDSAARHVRGRAIYIDDIPEPPGTLQIYLALSERAHARITRLDVEAVRSAPGVAGVFTAKDIPGHNDVSPVKGDDPLFADGLVQYFGQPLFAVAASTIGEARAAAKLAVVDYQELPAMLTIDRGDGGTEFPGAAGGDAARRRRPRRSRRHHIASRAASRSAARSTSTSRGRCRWRSPAKATR